MPQWMFAIVMEDMMLKTTAPFTSYTMLMEFNPLDVVVPAGHTLRIDLTENGEDCRKAHVQQIHWVD